MNRAVFASATLTGLLVFCLNTVALDSDLSHRNNHNKQYHHSLPNSAFNQVDGKTKQVIRTDYRKVRERVKADHLRRHRYASHHPSDTKVSLDGLVVMYLDDHSYQSDH